MENHANDFLVLRHHDPHVLQRPCPPHFHAVYGDSKAQVAIGDGRILRGSLPPKQRRLVERWALRYNESLMAAWALAGADEPFERIPELDADDDP